MVMIEAASPPQYNKKSVTPRALVVRIRVHPLPRVLCGTPNESLAQETPAEVRVPLCLAHEKPFRKFAAAVM